MEVVSSSSTPKRTRIARSKSTASEQTESPSPVTKKPAARKKKAAAPRDVAQDVSGMIATAAYYLAERRNFAPGHELEDWLEAETEIKSKLGGKQGS
jgi:hypothetical protein